MPATAVLMPTTRPRPSTSAPPELPGFSAASVWITSSTMRAARARAGRQRAAERGDDAGRDRAREAVRVADRDHELADAQLGGVAERGRLRSRGASARRTARSDSGSVPTTRSVELAAVGERGAHARRRAPSTTCAEVSRKPSGVITTPEPPPRAAAAGATRRFATDGATAPRRR